MRMKDLKATLIQAKYNKDLYSLVKGAEYSEIVTDLGIDMVNLGSLLSGDRNGVNVMKINENLEKTETLLGNFENKLKFGQHDS